MRIICQDGKTFDPAEAKCVGSVSTARSRDIHDQPIVGEYPVFVEQHGAYRMFTYSKKIKSILDVALEPAQVALAAVESTPIPAETPEDIAQPKDSEPFNHDTIAAEFAICNDALFISHGLVGGGRRVWGLSDKGKAWAVTAGSNSRIAASAETFDALTEIGAMGEKGIQRNDASSAVHRLANISVFDRAPGLNDEWAAWVDANKLIQEAGGAWHFTVLGRDLLGAIQAQADALLRLKNAPPVLASAESTLARETPEDIARRVMGNKFKASYREASAIGQAVAAAGYDRGTQFATTGADGRHWADVIADENLRTAPEAKIRARIAAFRRSASDTETRRNARILSGRTRGAGAGGFNRDIGRINDRMDEADSEAGRLEAEIQRRAAKLEPPKVIIRSEATPKPMQIVLARVEQEQVVVKEGRVDIGEMHTFKQVPKPVSVMWANEGTQADVDKAEAFAAKEGYTVLCYTGEADPLARAKADVLLACHRPPNLTPQARPIPGENPRVSVPVQLKLL